MNFFFKVELENGCTVYYSSLGKFACVYTFLNYLINSGKYANFEIIGVKAVKRIPQDYFEID